MEYGNGNVGNGQYSPLDGGYGMGGEGQRESQYMSHDYDQSRAYGNGMQSSYDEGRGGNSASFGGPGYRSALRHNKVIREMNSRNGLYSPSERSGRGNGDYYNSLPGLGGYEAQGYRPRDNGNSQYY